MLRVNAVRKNDVALCFELLEVVDDEAVEETVTVIEGGLVNNYRNSLCLDALHDALMADARRLSLLLFMVVGAFCCILYR